jgi:PAS domain S-box-containing protein
MNTLEFLVCKTFTSRLPSTAILICDTEMQFIHQSGELDFLELHNAKSPTEHPLSQQAEKSIHHLSRALKGEDSSLRQPYQNAFYQQYFMPIYDDNASIIAAVMFAYRVEPEYLKNSSPYRALFNQTNDAVFIIDPDGHFLDTNLYAERMLGYSGETLLTLTIEKIIPEKEHTPCRLHFERLLNGGTVSVYECEFTHADGSPRIGQVNLSLLYNTRTHQDMIQCVVRDITEAKAAEKALRDSEARFRLIVETTTDLIYEWDLLTSRVWYSQGLQHLFDRVDTQNTTAEYLGEWWYERIHPDDRERIQAQFMEVLAQGEASFKRQYRWRRIDGQYAEMTEHVRIIHDHDGRAIRCLGTLTDISEQRRIAEQEIALRLEKARNEIFNNFVTSLSHDFRTPLSIIHNNTYLLGKVKDIQEQTRLQAVIRSQARQIEKLVDSLLVMAQVERLTQENWRILDLNELIQYVIVRIESQKTSDIPIQLQLDEALPNIDGEAQWITRALTAVIENAVRFTPSGWVKVCTCTQDQQVRVRIEDTGIGIDSSDLQHIFEPLYLVDKHRPLGNQGLGLAIANRIIEQHGGKISVESVKSKGSTFTFTFPISSM